ncbi:hypothetical protein niasHT_010364 [Heterodera trifolii]|uniref:tRNA (34-2'-O)-methyltransferase regulator WDR6 n=1 Tax=Heterodera trifolii TaxID=157864 RepID=A0ABD2M6R9_9BILA
MATTNSNQISVYAASKFRVDINVSTRDESHLNNRYEILMEIITTDGGKQTILLDAKALVWFQMTAISVSNFRVRFHSIPISLPRLSFASLSFTLSCGTEFTLRFSSHGSYVEIFSDCSRSYKMIDTFDAFPSTKSTMHQLFPFGSCERKFSLLCIGECEFAFFTATKFENAQLDNAREEKCWDWKRMAFGTFSDWILSAKILNEEKKDESTFKSKKLFLTLHFANNWIKTMKLPEGEIGVNVSLPEEVFSVRLGCQALVTSSFLHGNSWPSLCVFSGTSFGAIHFFQPAIGPQILRTFAGNEGMPFAIRCDSNFRWLFSVGDDRSLRIWDIQKGAQLFSKFGHGARPFALEICEGEQMIFTAGIDNYICIWRWSMDEKKVINRLFLQRKIDISAATGGGGTIKSILLLKTARRDTGGGIGSSVNATQFASSVGFKKMSAFAFVRLRGMPFLVFLDENKMLSVEQIDGENEHSVAFADQIRAHFSDSNGRPMVFRSDLFCFSESARCLALCAEFDRSLHFALFGECSFSICQSNFAQTEQFLWLQPESSRMLLAIAQNGQMVIYRICTSVDGNLQEISRLYSEKKVGKVQVALLINDNEKETDLPTSGVFLLGTRSGTLLAFSIHSGKLLLFNRIAHGTNDYEKTVTDLRIEAINHSERAALKGNLISIGRDGILKRWHFQWERRKPSENGITETFSLEPFSVRHLSIEWPCKIVSLNNSAVFLVGFHSDEFVVMDFKTFFILSTFRCGGGNRKWQFVVGTEANRRTLSLAYICKGVLRRVLLDFVEFCPIRPFLHSDDIVTMTSLEQNGHVLLLSGGTDRRLALSLFKPLATESINGPNCFASSFFCLDSSIVHRSNLECVYVVDDWPWHNETTDSGKRDKLILSVGARSEICAWKLQVDNGNADNEPGRKCLPQLHFLSSTEISAQSSGAFPPHDCRLLAVRRLLYGPFLALLCSDGSLRIAEMFSSFRHPFPTFSLIFSKWTIRIPSLAMFTALELLKHNKALLCTATDGHLYAFAIFESMLQKHFGDSETVEFVDNDNSQSSHWNPFFKLHFSPFLIEKCGLSSLATATVSEDSIILIGSESGRISILEWKLGRKTPQEEAPGVVLLTRGDWHASTVTALQAVPSAPSSFFILSVSLDCRLGLGLYDTLCHEIRPLRLFPLCVSDPAFLLVLPFTGGHSPSDSSFLPHTFSSHNQRIDCFVSGYGIEHLQLIVYRTDPNK